MNYEYTNIVPKEKLREIQLNTLNLLSEVVSHTAGPLGSNTQLLHEKRYNEYTKDGHNVLSQIKFYKPLENAIQTEMKEITRYIVKTVGDGTTSAVMLSSSIFEFMCNAELSNVAPYRLMKLFKEIVDELIKRIRNKRRICTLQDIYDICMIATNGNSEVSDSIRKIYEEFGKDVFIDVGVSNTSDHLVKKYDGLTLDVGYPTPAYINTPGDSKESGRAIIRKPKIYAFEDPIDTPEMLAFFATIIQRNIYDPMYAIAMSQRKEVDEELCVYTPTVILAPSISRDGNKILTDIEKVMYGFESDEMSDEEKPPLLIITEASINPEQYGDIVMLCGAPAIRKYIDPDVQKKDIENGDAPTPETICDWCGSADEVIADTMHTKFVNPKRMFNIKNGEREYSSVYNGLVNYIKQELDIAYKNNEDNNVTGKLRRRLNSLQTNLVEYLIGGITVTDRDSVRDLVEDAVLNCRSAAKNGVGYGANFEAFEEIYYMYKQDDSGDLVRGDILGAIYNAYYNVLHKLYMTATGDAKEANDLIGESIRLQMPVNLTNMQFDGTVLCSIETDVAILEAISKVIMVMFTANQALLESPLNNTYLE